MNTHTPAVTVVVACYDDADTLGATVRSIMDQSLSDIEILVVDDGSSNPSDMELPDDPRIRLHTFTENRGYAAVTNFAMAEATADWLIFVDADDTIEPGCVETLLSRADESGAQAVVTALNFGDREGRRRPAPWSGPDRVVDAKLAIDLVLAGTRRVALVSEPLYNYTISAGSVTGSLRENVWDLVAAAEEAEVTLQELFGAESPARVERLHSIVVQQLVSKAAREPEPTALGADVYRYCRPRISWLSIRLSYLLGDRSTAASLALARLSPRLHRRVYELWNSVKEVTP